MKAFPLVVCLFLLAVILAACASGKAATPVLSTDPASEPTGAPQAVQAPQPTETRPAPTLTAMPPVSPKAAPAESAGSSFVIFDKEAGVFRSYGMDGSLRYEAPAPGLEYPDFFTDSVVKDAVYFAANGSDRPIYRTSVDGAKKLDLTLAKLSALRVSPDEKWIAWSTFIGDTTPPSSELWLGKLDGKGGVTDAKKIAAYNMGQSSAFWLVPVDWSADSSQLFLSRSLTGLGGYIPFGGLFSIYSYDLASGEFSAYSTPEENNGMCVDSIRLDLEKLVFNCRQGSQQIIVRSLKDGLETTIPAIPEQGVAGGAEFSPSGEWLAYATARNNPDDEAGQVAIIAGDLSGEPNVIYKVGQKRYPVVQGWVDEQTLLITVTNNTIPGNTILTIKRDGTDAAQLATGWFVGWVK